MKRLVPVVLAPLALAACQSDTPVQSTPAPSPPASQGSVPSGYPLAPELTRLEWSKAENRKDCAPIVFTNSGGAGVNARAAEYSGGWAVAYDLPGMRSAFGVAGSGLLDGDGDDMRAKERQLRAQWPYFRMLSDLPQPSFAGYGVQGAKAYPADNPGGTGLDSLAYVQISGQKCLYNVWSKLGREHLETLLVSLRML
ncbi:hypothetical protein NT2_10_00800 [Caenibius tardaugens NBRC 16725]|uniref:Lipoprotein n=1 Tax=Caenibius tardaugens NBRC 16725 TaxID=1219035 RepID=U2YP09_9SPHN|nr:hypothetical protein [Caenibius tardaugens]AZI35801.1 hypothetical protein EGO55_07270 [Caenibius tardaugens NBRC 16725]GAD50635.1 hypothetical protein NT2_10_00800 [Caenibius tardaugens NBRC 16725]